MKFKILDFLVTLGACILLLIGSVSENISTVLVAGIILITSAIDKSNKRE